jgi:hypothetical protein
VRDIPVTPITFGVASRIALGYTGRDVYDSPSTLAGSMEHERTAWLAKMRFPLNFYLSSETLPNVPLIGQFWTPPRGSAAHDAGIPGTQLAPVTNATAAMPGIQRAQNSFSLHA